MNERNCEICSDTIPIKRGNRERNSFAVAIITLVTMAAEIIFGLLTGSMALLADGIHMGTHALALFITALAYLLSRKWQRHEGFSFGTGKISVLSGYTNALFLAGTALFMVVEAVKRLVHPERIAFDTAILVAVIGLAVNLVSVLILGAHDHEEAHDHVHADGHAHEHSHSHEYGDSNLKAALAHVMADALTSVLAIGSLVAGKYLGLSFLDSAVALLGAFLILRWAYFLLKDTSVVLLDFGDYREELEGIRSALKAEGVSLRDIHIWRYSENERALMLSVSDPGGRGSEEIRRSLASIGHFEHVTVEVLAP